MNSLRAQYAHNLITSRLDPASSDSATEAAVANSAAVLGLPDAQVARDRAMLDELAAALRSGDGATEARIRNSPRWIALAGDADAPCESTDRAIHMMD